MDIIFLTSCTNLLQEPYFSMYRKERVSYLALSRSLTQLFSYFRWWRVTQQQSYEIKSPAWTILWFRILGIFFIENIKRLCVFMFQTWDNSQLLRRVLWISAELTIVSSLKHKNKQTLYVFNRVGVLHLDRLKEGTWRHSFAHTGIFGSFDFLQFEISSLMN